MGELRGVLAASRTNSLSEASQGIYPTGLLEGRVWDDSRLLQDRNQLFHEIFDHALFRPERFPLADFKDALLPVFVAYSLAMGAEREGIVRAAGWMSAQAPSFSGMALKFEEEDCASPHVRALRLLQGCLVRVWDAAAVRSHLHALLFFFCNHALARRPHPRFWELCDAWEELACAEPAVAVRRLRQFHQSAEELCMEKSLRVVFPLSLNLCDRYLVSVARWIGEEGPDLRSRLTGTETAWAAVSPLLDMNRSTFLLMLFRYVQMLQVEPSLARERSPAPRVVEAVRALRGLLLASENETPARNHALSKKMGAQTARRLSRVLLTDESGCECIIHAVTVARHFSPVAEREDWRVVVEGAGSALIPSGISSDMEALAVRAAELLRVFGAGPADLLARYLAGEETGERAEVRRDAQSAFARGALAPLRLLCLKAEKGAEELVRSAPLLLKALRGPGLDNPETQVWLRPVVKKWATLVAKEIETTLNRASERVGVALQRNDIDLVQSVGEDLARVLEGFTRPLVALGADEIVRIEAVELFERVSLALEAFSIRHCTLVHSPYTLQPFYQYPRRLLPALMPVGQEPEAAEAGKEAARACCRLRVLRCFRTQWEKLSVFGRTLFVARGSLPAQLDRQTEELLAQLADMLFQYHLKDWLLRRPYTASMGPRDHELVLSELEGVVREAATSAQLLDSASLRFYLYVPVLNAFILRLAWLSLHRRSALTPETLKRLGRGFDAVCAFFAAGEASPRNAGAMRAFKQFREHFFRETFDDVPTDPVVHFAFKARFKR